ncbi:SRPBCC family protein [Streptomyces sp. NPDC000880]
MELHHQFTVPVPVDEAWRVLLDIERIAPCMPGATVEGFDGEHIMGRVKVKVGPITVTYLGTAVFEEMDESAHRIVLTANGKEVRGQGTARATVTGTLAEEDGGTAVTVVTDLTITGRPAQFGRGVMADVGDKLVGQFADCVSRKLASGEPSASTPPGAGAATGAATSPDLAEAASAEPAVFGRTGWYEAEPIDLLRTAGVPVAKRAAVVLVVAALAALTVILIRRKR